MADLTGMLQAAAGNAGEEADEDFANTVLLLHGDGTNGAQNNTFLDSSTNNFTITRNGNTTQGTFSPFSKPDGRWGNSFLSDTDYITCTSNAAYQFNTGDFTVECWLYTTALVGVAAKIFQYATDGNFSSGGYGLEQSSASNLTWGRSTGTVTLSTSVPVNEWFHFAIVRSSGTLTAYINGTSVYSAADSYNYNYGGAHPFSIGSGRDGSGTFTNDYTGYISNFRAVKGTAVYTSAFTPSTTPLTAISGTSLLTCQSNRFVDNSSNAFAITAAGNVKVTPFSPFPITTAYTPTLNGGAGYFDNSGDYLTAAGNAAFDMSTGDFTWEAWAYIPSDNAGSAVFAINGAELFFRSTANGQKVAFYNGSVIAESDTAYSFNQWNHVAVTRSGTTLRVYLNGVSGPSATHSSSVGGSANTLYIGSWTDGSSDSMFGWMSNARIVKGTAVYTGSSFTLPTSPLTAIANTSLLCNFTNAGILDNTCFNALETVGNAQIDTTTKKYGTGSLDFAANDGTAYLLLPASDNTALGGDFTVEFWLNPDTITTSYADSSLATLLDSDVATGTGTEWWAIHQINNTLQFVHNGAARLTSDAELSASTWQHCAFVRSGSTLTCYIDGVAEGSTTYSTAVTGSRKLYIAKQPGASRFYKGYIDDLRITKGIARYTTTFTPPDKAFPDFGE